MKTTRTSAPLGPVDWVLLTARGLFLLSIPLVAELLDGFDRDLAILLAPWAAITLLFGLVRAGGWKPMWGEFAIVLIDLGFALAIIQSTGGLGSPLWWSLQVASVTMALAYGLRASLFTTGIGLLAVSLVILIAGGGGSWVLIPLGLHVGAQMLATALLGWPGEMVRRKALAVGREQRLDLDHTMAAERKRVQEVFGLAAVLSATLERQRVADLALDLGARIMAEGRDESAGLVSALWLLEGQQLRLISARRLTAADRQVELRTDSGLAGAALTQGSVVHTRQLGQDPSFGRMVALERCRAAVCVPLKHGEPLGIMLFAHPALQAFSEERMELLQALGQQTAIALENAQQYHTLKEEKELMTEIQEEGRKKLARDLHDGPTQTVAAITMRVNFARRLIDRDAGGAIEELEKVEDMARRTTKEIRHMLFTLRPLILESKGLVAALIQLAEKSRDTHGLNIQVDADPEAVLGMDMETQGVIFYIAEEAINNARKHAEASQVWVRMLRRGERFILEVEDDGVGFNVGSVDQHYEQRGSLGMVNMRERTELVGGDFNIKSAEGEGTTIIVSVPACAPESEAGAASQ